MELHLPTLIKALLMMSATLLLVVGTLAWRTPRDGLRAFTAGLALLVVSFGLIGLRGRLPDAALFSLAHVTMPAGFAMFNIALHRFFRRPMLRVFLWGPVLLALALQPWVYGNPTERVILISTILTFQCATGMMLLLRHGGETSGIGRPMMAVNFGGIIALLLYRIAVVVNTPATMQPAERLVQMQSVSFMFAGMTMTVLALAFVIMTKEAADERNRILATRDELTGLDNRRTLQERLEEHVALARRSGLPLTAMMLDIDHFKSINDRFGHLSGDEAIRKVAGLMREMLRRQDLIGRMGGEEFLIVLPATGIGAALEIAERIRAGIEAAGAVSVEGRPIRVTASVGVSAFDPEAGIGIETLIHRADEAMYRAKAQGRNRVVAA
ncbi:MAG: hypothetical protein RIS35_714 [Pseudomonadota bacterium]|jgi:diguanylate cyclase (GGDEF)-like protein